MTLTDTRLTDPTAKAVRAAIGAALDALAALNAPVRGPLLPSEVEGAARCAAATREGMLWWESSPYRQTRVPEEGEVPPPPPEVGLVSVAWWTAISGRRHVRVIGRVMTDEPDYWTNDTKLNTRPPVWHVFPDRVYRRRVGKVNDLVAVCGCGAIGTEAALGWAGPYCGPCADYREEHGALPWTRAAFFPTPSACVAVAGSADGRRVAAAFASGTEVRVWDTDAPAAPVFSWRGAFADAAAAHLALSPDGRYLALSAPANNRLHVLDLTSATPREAIQMTRADAIAFHPVTGALYFVTNGTVLMSAPPDARATGSGVPAADVEGPLAFSANGARLAVRHERTFRVYDLNGTERAAVPFPRNATSHEGSSRSGRPRVALSPDGGQVAVGHDRAVAVHHAVTGERRFYDGRLEADVTGLAFAPGGEWLYVGRHDGTLNAYHTSTFAAERKVVLRWSLGPIRALAPCGDALLSACDEGVQAWPMAKLLEGLG